MSPHCPSRSPSLCFLVYCEQCGWTIKFTMTVEEADVRRGRRALIESWTWENGSWIEFACTGSQPWVLFCFSQSWASLLVFWLLPGIIQFFQSPLSVPPPIMLVLSGCLSQVTVSNSLLPTLTGSLSQWRRRKKKRRKRREGKEKEEKLFQF